MKSKQWIILGIAIITLSSAFGIGYKNSWWRNRPPLPDAFVEYKRIYKAYSQPDTNSMILGQIELFDEQKNMELKEVMNFATYRTGSLFYSSYGPIKMICDGKRLIVVDSSLQRIEYTLTNEVLLQQIMNLNPGSSSPLDELLKDTANFKIRLNLEEKGDRRILAIQSDFHPEISSAAVTYDPADAKIYNSEVKWKSNENPIGENNIGKGWIAKIKYEYRLAENINPAAMINAIVMEENGKLILTANYKAYELIVNNNN